jgi:hypothetical protein
VKKTKYIIGGVVALGIGLSIPHQDFYVSSVVKQK